MPFVIATKTRTIETKNKACDRFIPSNATADILIYVQYSIKILLSPSQKLPTIVLALTVEYEEFSIVQVAESFLLLKDLSQKKLPITNLRRVMKTFISFLLASSVHICFATNLGIVNKMLRSIKVPTIVASAASALISIHPGFPLHPLPANALSEMRYGAMADVGVGQFLVKDSKQHLRLSLPVGENMALGPSTSQDPGRQAQEALELIRLRTEQVGFANKVVWQGLANDAGTAQRILTKQRDSFIEGTKSPSDAAELLDKQIMPNIAKLLEATKSQDIKTTLALQDETADKLTTLRSMKLPDKKLPYEIPSEYNDLPRLAGRAIVEMKIDHKNGFRNADGTILKSPTFLLEVDGYHAPLTAGNFIDLVDQKFYDGTPLSSEELTVQVTPKNINKDKKTGSKRKIPLEIFYKIDKEPTYGITSDDDDRATDTMALPFQAYGAIGMSRENDDPDSGSANLFFLKWRQALIAPGRNTIDGFYTCFGYIYENEDLLKQISDGDTIISAKTFAITCHLYNIPNFHLRSGTLQVSKFQIGLDEKLLLDERHIILSLSEELRHRKI
eukprot:gene3107-6097_t